MVARKRLNVTLYAHCLSYFASTAEGILEDIMTGRVQGAPLHDKHEVEEEEVDQQPPNRPPSHSEALQHVHSLMQSAQTNLPHLQPTLINIYSEIERNWATAIQKKKPTTLHQFLTTPKLNKKVLFM